MLGSGEWQYESYFRELHDKYPDKVGLRLGFVPDLARKIYAGADLFLMPSKSEPCGLSQMVALRYGTLPIVRETGGLKDSVTDSGDGEGNGFTFKHTMLMICSAQFTERLTHIITKNIGPPSLSAHSAAI